jgi:hypothetical protein
LISLLPPSTLSSLIYTRKEEETITKKEGNVGGTAPLVDEEKLSSKGLEAMINKPYQLTNAIYRNGYDGPIIELQLLLLKLYSSQMNYWKEKQKLDFILSSLQQLESSSPASGSSTSSSSSTSVLPVPSSSKTATTPSVIPFFLISLIKLI